MVRFQTRNRHVLMGAQYIPSQRTYKAIRIVGVLLIILDLIIAIRILK
jgi:hypothetical protein